MRAGALRHRVEVQSVTHTVDSGGGAADTWATDTNGTCWMSIEPQDGSEFIEAGAVTSRVTHKMQTRYRSDVTVTPAKRLLFGTRTFNVLSVIKPGEIGHLLTIMAEESPP